jgi:hypothetical protein
MRREEGGVTDEERMEGWVDEREAAKRREY